jgi:hypothetical protein
MDACLRLGFFLLLVAAAFAPLVSAQLSADFYKTSCPDAEKIILGVVEKRFKADPGTAAGLLRLVFHDCFANVRKRLASRRRLVVRALLSGSMQCMQRVTVLCVSPSRAATRPS